MIYIYSTFLISDNSGVLSVFGLRNLSRKSMFCTLGDVILATIKTSTQKNKFLKPSILVKGIIVREKTFKWNKNVRVRFNENSIVLIDNKQNMLGSRILGSIPKVVASKYKKLGILNNSLV